MAGQNIHVNQAAGHTEEVSAPFPSPAVLYAQHYTWQVTCIKIC